jgi:hypothetical protein
MEKKYPIVLGCIAFFLCGAVGVFNYKVDPYLLFGFKAADSDRLSRIDQFNHMRITKPWYLREVKPTAVIVGSSRSARIQPQHESWVGENGFNMAVPGMTPEEILRFLQYAQSINALSKVMIGLDYEAFIRPSPVVRPGYEDDRMIVNNKESLLFAQRKQRIRDVFDSLFSIPALSRSLAAVTQVSKPGRQYFKDGTWETTTTFFTGHSGYAYIGRNVIQAHRTTNFSISENLLRLEVILRFCHENRIDARLFFTPTHVFFVDLWLRLGYSMMWQEFHRQAVALNVKVASEAGREPFPLWGFSHADTIVNEPIFRGKKSARSWYDDGVHSRIRLGSKLMNDVWGSEGKIGVRVTGDNVETYLAETLRMTGLYITGNPDLVKELHKEIGLEK